MKFTVITLQVWLNLIQIKVNLKKFFVLNILF